MSGKILIYGMGLSGRGVAKLLKDKSESLLLYDANVNFDMSGLIREMDLKGASYITGNLKKKYLEGVETLILSPGVSINAPDIKMAREAGIKILGEVEIAFETSKGKLIAITGTNGKTTTTALTGEIMKAAFSDVYVVGNIGNSYASVSALTREETVTVAEISSFQLESISEFHPVISAVLNLTPDHLDRHGTFENYAMCKMEIARNQTSSEICVINYDDEYLRSLAEDITPKKLYFSMNPLPEGVYLKGDDIVYNDGSKETFVINRYDMNLVGDHNVRNVCAAVGISVSMGVDIEVIANTVRNFKAVEHRIEYTCERKGVKYYNDSKGTNTDAAAKAVAAMSSPTVLIAGGYDKGADFTDWINGFDGHIKAMVLIGQTAEQIRETAIACGFTNIYIAKDLKMAVDVCAKIANPGENVLLSPACASWGQFKNYEERGRLFKEYARALPE